MDSENIRIESLKKYDIEITIKLYRISLQDNKTGFIQDIDFRQNIQNMIKELRPDNGDIYVLKRNERVVAMGALKKVDDTTVEMCKLHIYPNLKGRGLGKKLALALIAFAKEKGYKTINLHVTKTQKEAIGLYTKLGFYEYKPSKLCKIQNKGKTLEFNTLYMERHTEEVSLNCV